MVAAEVVRPACVFIVGELFIWKRSVKEKSQGCSKDFALTTRRMESMVMRGGKLWEGLLREENILEMLSKRF